MNSVQRGYALILVLAILMLAGALFVAARGVPLFAQEQSVDPLVLSRLLTVKAALIGRQFADWTAEKPAVITETTERRDGKPGTFSCPDVDTGTGKEGQSDGICFKSQNWVVGRLQWKDLGLPYSADTSEECVWLAISTAYLKTTDNSARDDSDPFRKPINPTNKGAIQLAVGSNSPKPIVALLIAPGRPLPSQLRATSSSQSCRDGLRTEFFEKLGNYDNATGTPAFASYNGRTVLSKTSGKCMPFDQLESDDIGEGPCFNDVVVPIEVDEVMQPLLAYILEKLADTDVFSKIDASVENGTKLASLRSPANQASFDSDVFNIDSAKLTYNKDGCACVVSEASFCEGDGSRDPVSWLSCNRWYDSIWVVRNETGVSLQLTTVSNSYRCTLKQGDKKPICSK